MLSVLSMSWPFGVLIAYCLVCRSIDVVASRIVLIKPEPVGGRKHRRQHDFEEIDCEYTEDLRDDQSIGATSHPTS